MLISFWHHARALLLSGTVQQRRPTPTPDRRLKKTPLIELDQGDHPPVSHVHEPCYLAWQPRPRGRQGDPAGCISSQLSRTEPKADKKRKKKKNVHVSNPYLRSHSKAMTETSNNRQHQVAQLKTPSLCFHRRWQGGGHTLTHTPNPTRS